jgi:hypothetical protein
MGDFFYQNNIAIIFGIPNARMSSCLYFQGFRPFPRLDKFVSGIPNAMPSQISGRKERCGGRRPAFAPAVNGD